MTEFLKAADCVKEARRIVVKVGTSVLTDPREDRVAQHCVRAVVDEVCALRRQGKQVLVITSGAIGVGMRILGLKGRPRELARLQAAAATGQGRLMQWYAAQFEQQGQHAAQVLITRDDLEDPRRYRNARATLATLLRAGVVPVINENDTVSTEEIRYGDNDVLSAHVAVMMHADLLVILSDVDQFHGPTGLQSVVTEITPELERSAGGTTRAVSTGGMRTKLEAAKLALSAGIPILLTNGRREGALVKAVLRHEFSGTWFLPKKGLRLKGKQRAAVTGRPRGTVWVDSGAREALARRRLSLLASGVASVEGSFQRGDLVSVSEMGSREEFARGYANYSNVQLQKIRGLRSQEIAALLGERAVEVIHRDSLVILRE